MDFGMPTLLEFESLAKNDRLARELGLKFVEINMNLPMFQLFELRKLDLAPSDGLYHTIHLDENLNPFDFNPYVAAAYSKTARQCVCLAREAGMPVVNMHFPLGVYFTMRDGKVSLWDRHWGHLRDSILRFRDEMTCAAGDNVKICVENTSFGRFAHQEEALDILLESPAFGLTYDCGHDMTDGMRASKFYEARKDRLFHMHLHDADYKNCHLALGDGKIDISRMCRADCRKVVEVKDSQGLISSIEYLKQHALN